jgi:uncharacterized membrane protein YgdD (TMEM256/DUF423 family)
MRFINILAALSGFTALAMLTIAAHALRLETADMDRIHLAAFVQLAAAGAGLAITGRKGALNLAAGAMILTGAAIFAVALYVLAVAHANAILMLAPVGGITLLLGWLLLAFTKPAVE